MSIWTQMADRQSEWVGGMLEDWGDSMDARLFPELIPMRTEITGIEVRPNGDSQWFGVSGKDFNCGFDVRYGGVSGSQEPGWMEFSGYAGHRWRIKPPATEHTGAGLSPSGGELQATPVAVPSNTSEPVPGLSKEDV